MVPKLSRRRSIAIIAGAGAGGWGLVALLANLVCAAIAI